MRGRDGDRDTFVLLSFQWEDGGKQELSSYRRWGKTGQSRDEETSDRGSELREDTAVQDFGTAMNPPTVRTNDREQ